MSYLPPPTIKGSNFSNEKIEFARINNKLLSLTILLSNKCNLNCLYCYRDAGKNGSELFMLSDWEVVIYQAKELGAESLWIPGSGEPFFDKSFFNKGNFPILNFASSLDLHTTFFTNGTVVTNNIAEKLIEYDVSVVTKLNSFDPRTQDFLAGKKNSFRLIQKGLKSLIKVGLNNFSPTRLGIDTVITSQNYLEIKEIFKFCRDSNIIPYITINLHGGRSCTNLELDVSKDKIKNLFEEILEIDQSEYGCTWFPSPPIIGSQCKKLLYDIVVDYRGDVFICPGIDIKIGNIKESSLNSIINESSILKQVRKMPETLHGKCGSCSNKDCIYGCRLEASYNGDLFGEDPFCWH